MQNQAGDFRKTSQPEFQNDKAAEASCSELFDADGDGDLDLYVCSGGNEFPLNAPELSDRLYLNDGKGNFTRAPRALPPNIYENDSCVKSCDFDRDGDYDLFIGVRAKPFQYGMPANGYLLRNNGKGKFDNVTQSVAPELIGIGMIADACWFDYDGDEDSDLIIVGDWMPVTLFKNEGGTFTNVTVQAGLHNTDGFWNCIEVADIDADGDLDFVAGNHGTNTRLKASHEKPVTMYVNDFDGNGKLEQIITTINSGNQFKEISLPEDAQFSPIYAISIEDYDNDQTPDILAGGNFYWSKPEVGIYDGSRGLLLKGHGDGTFTSIAMENSGICIRGEIRDIKMVKAGREQLIVVVRNNETPVILKRNKS
jgi:enediyne biosynthesis protein E4